MDAKPIYKFELRYRGVVPTAQMRGSMSRWTAIGFLPLLTACNRPDTGGTLTEHYLVDDASAGFDLQPVSNGTAFQWIGAYSSQGKIARFRIKFGPAIQKSYFCAASARRARSPSRRKPTRPRRRQRRFLASWIPPRPPHSALARAGEAMVASLGGATHPSNYLWLLFFSRPGFANPVLRLPCAFSGVEIKVLLVSRLSILALLIRLTSGGGTRGESYDDEYVREFHWHLRGGFRYYEKHLGARAGMMMTHAQAPDRSRVKPEWKDAVLHARIFIGDMELMAADIPNAEPMRSAYLTLRTDSDVEAERIYAALSDSGQILMPMEETFFSSRFGQVRDRFGINWMIRMSGLCHRKGKWTGNWRDYYGKVL